MAFLRIRQKSDERSDRRVRKSEPKQQKMIELLSKDVLHGSEPRKLAKVGFGGLGWQRPELQENVLFSTYARSKKTYFAKITCMLPGTCSWAVLTQVRVSLLTKGQCSKHWSFKTMPLAVYVSCPLSQEFTRGKLVVSELLSESWKRLWKDNCGGQG